MVHVLDTGKQTAKENMQIDHDLLLRLQPDDSPILHFYDWAEPSITHGYFIEVDKFLKKTEGIAISRRPTGGGILFHMWDFTFSVFIPKNHEGYSNDVLKNYRYINDRVVIALKEFFQDRSPLNLLPEEPLPLNPDSKFFCFAKPTKYDVMIGGKKVAGAAQRRKQNGYLHQGSISLVSPNFELLSTLLVEPGVLDAMKCHTFAPLPHNTRPLEIENAKVDIKRALQKTFSSTL